MRDIQPVLLSGVYKGGLPLWKYCGYPRYPCIYQ
nr:MAG TPA: hypothetical protein [Caudoviricetes sp.]